VKIDELQAGRDQALEDMPRELVNIFERVSARHEGEVLAVVVQENPRRQEFSCGGCSMAVTLEQFNRLQDRNEIVTCNVCGRILHLPD
jgi:predicted  nucleic acid-binding Zn-ribbon protein